MNVETAVPAIKKELLSPRNFHSEFSTNTFREESYNNARKFSCSSTESFSSNSSDFNFDALTQTKEQSRRDFEQNISNREIQLR